MKILAVFAHPDDEAFGPGGTLARYGLNGNEVRLVTMTRGEAGSLGISKNLPPEELARKRSQELDCAARKLGINQFKIYELPDKKLKEYPEPDGIFLIQKEIEDFDPDIVITFHPNGISGHPDHQTVSRWTLQAVRQSNRGCRLFYYGLTPEQTTKVTHRTLYAMTEEEITHLIEVSDYLSLKTEAMQCHFTQQELWDQLRSVPEGYESFAGKEYFSEAWPPTHHHNIKSNLPE